MPTGNLRFLRWMGTADPSHRFAEIRRTGFDFITKSAPWSRRLGVTNDQGSEERSRTMKIIGCDFHPGYQQIAMLDQETGEVVEMTLWHEAKQEVRCFYAGLSGPVRVGMEASGQSQWFERMLAELGQEVWIGDAAKIRASSERKQKTDRRDALLLLQLLAEGRFPRI